MIEEERRVRSENEQFITEIIELVKDIKKYSDPALSSSQTWIEKTFVERISKQLVMISSYLPGHINIEKMVKALLFEHGIQILENVMIEMPNLLKTILRSGGRQILATIIERLLKMTQNVLTWQAAPTSDAPEMGEAPWCTRLSFCLVDLLNSTLGGVEGAEHSHTLPVHLSNYYGAGQGSEGGLHGLSPNTLSNSPHYQASDD